MNTVPQQATDKSRQTFWRPLIARVLQSELAPFYLFSHTPMEEARTELESLSARINLPVRHWYSCKTQPLPSALAAWKRQGGCIEVVSELELKLAQATGFDVDHILINGPIKHNWLAPLAEPRQRVHFDSAREIEILGRQASRQRWRVGIRLLLNAEFDPEHPEWPTQFGLDPGEAKRALRILARHQLEVESVHFHLRTNISNPEIYRDALMQAATLCRELGLKPRSVDCGGGFPPPHILSRDGRRYDRKFNFRSWASMVNQALREFPSASELWLENGRFVTARGGVLVVRALDAKTRRGMRHLICNGGKTMHALVSHWERHELWSIPRRTGTLVPTIVSGPTCMAFDKLAHGPMPSTLRPGDHLVWMDAGAYHLPWETRFSHGLAPVWWHEGESIRPVRKREGFAQWNQGWA